MHLFWLNLFFAAVFTLLMGSSGIQTFLMGFVLGYGILWLTSPLYPDSRYFKKLPRILNLIGYFTAELLISNLRVLWDVITPGHINRPGIIGIPLTAQTDMEIFWVANLISLTPGTLSLDLSEDRSTLYVHVMFLEDVEKTRAAIREGLEKRILEVLRA
jgi:multicomponent Na+:H+ antiporter subunit E